MVKHLHHTGFVVTDRDKAVEFYRDVVGLELIAEYERIGPGIDAVIGYENTHLVIANLDLGGGHILELIQYLNPPPSERPTTERNIIGASHLALQVDDIQAVHEKLIKGGAKSMNPPAELAPGRVACYIQDPDGNWLEILQLG